MNTSKVNATLNTSTHQSTTTTSKNNPASFLSKQEEKVFLHRVRREEMKKDRLRARILKEQQQQQQHEDSSSSLSQSFQQKNKSFLSSSTSSSLLSSRSNSVPNSSRSLNTSLSASYISGNAHHHPHHAHHHQTNPSDLEEETPRVLIHKHTTSDEDMSLLAKDLTAKYVVIPPPNKKNKPVDNSANTSNNAHLHHNGTNTSYSNQHAYKRHLLEKLYKLHMRDVPSSSSTTSSSSSSASHSQTSTIPIPGLCACGFTPIDEYRQVILKHHPTATTAPAAAANMHNHFNAAVQPSIKHKANCEYYCPPLASVGGEEKERKLALPEIKYIKALANLLANLEDLYQI